MLVISNENEFLALDAWLNCFHLSCSCSCSTSTSPQYDVDFQDTRGVAAARRAEKEKREERGGRVKELGFLRCRLMARGNFPVHFTWQTMMQEIDFQQAQVAPQSEGQKLVRVECISESKKAKGRETEREREIERDEVWR